MRKISRVRFDALAGYCRLPQTLLFADELDWFEQGDERVLATLIRDRTDADFGGMILGRDQKGRLRWIGDSGFCASRRRAEAMLRREMERLAMAPDDEYYQGDESGPPVDVFTLVVSEDRLHQNFLQIANNEGYSPARGIIEPMMHWSRISQMIV